MSKKMNELFEEKARAGDGSFAIALAILQLDATIERLAWGTVHDPGVLEKIGIELSEIAKSIQA